MHFQRPKIRIQAVQERLRVVHPSNTLSVTRIFMVREIVFFESVLA